MTTITTTNTTTAITTTTCQPINNKTICIIPTG